MADPLLIQRDPSGVATLTLNRPDRRNALDETLIAALTEAVAALGSDPETRLLVLTGAGESFCAGGDLSDFARSAEKTREARLADSRRLGAMFKALDRAPQPLIGRINGSAYGGGVGMMAVCDLAIGLDGARFGLTETRLGLAPANISPYVIARIGAAGARATMLSGAPFGADRATALGLLCETAPDLAALDARLETILDAHLAASPAAAAATKRLIRRVSALLSGAESEAALDDLTAATLAQAWESPDGREGVRSFLEKRPPAWRRA